MSESSSDVVETAAQLIDEWLRFTIKGGTSWDRERAQAVVVELERLRGIEQQARALSLRSDRLYSLFVDATGYEPNLELGDDDDR